MSYEEREIKIRIPDAAACAAAVLGAGGRALEPRRLEDDRLFDDAEGGLAAADRVLRLRRKVPLEAGDEAGAGGLLTWKGPARVEDGLRVREEIETRVDDADALVLVLERLGYRSRFRYQKRRSLFDWRGALVAVDETPLGDFLEIEGEAAAIRELAERLGHSESDFLTGSYPALWREERGPEAGDMLLEPDRAP